MTNGSNHRLDRMDDDLENIKVVLMATARRAESNGEAIGKLKYTTLQSSQENDRKSVTPQVLATAKVNWLDSDQGGRSSPPSGPVYAATGRFAEHGDELFSVVLRFPLKNPQMHSLSEAQQSLDEAELGFLATELLEKKLVPGTKLLITEGPRVVAECEIQSVTSY